MRDPETRKHLRGSSLLLAGRLLAMGLNFAVQVLVVRYLTKSDYGAFAYALSWVALGTSLAQFGLDKPLAYFVPMYHERQEHAKMAGTIVFVLAAVLGLGISVVLLVFTLHGFLAGTMTSHPVSDSLLLLLILLVPLEAIDHVLERLFAIFAGARALFFRRHIVGPLLKLSAVLPLVMLNTGVYVFAVIYLIAGAVGTAYSLTVLARVFRQQSLWAHFPLRSLRVPQRQIIGFAIPLLSSDVAFNLRTWFTAFLLELCHGTPGVAAFRAVFPIARLNLLVMESFRALFVPTAARMMAREDHAAMNRLYWSNAVWIATLTFPAFAVSFVLAEPLVRLLFGEAYADSGVVLAWLAVGCYVNAAFGFNIQMLRVYGKVRAIVLVDVLTAVVAVTLNLLLVPRYAAWGGAVAYTSAIVLQNLLNKWSLVRDGAISTAPRPCVASYLSILGVTSALLAVQWLWSPPAVLGLALVALGSLVVVWCSLPALDVPATFPELARLRHVKAFLAKRAYRADALTNGHEPVNREGPAPVSSDCNGAALPRR